jgi:DNA-binding MarR family transcriptional regulator
MLDSKRNRPTPSIPYDKPAGAFDTRVDLLNGYMGLVMSRLIFGADIAVAREEAGLSMNEMRLIEFLGLNLRATMTEAATELHMALNSASGLVTRLSKRRLITRHRIPNDRRVVVVTLTASGKRLFQKVLDQHRRITSGLLAPLAPANQEKLIEIFREIADSLEDPTPSNPKNEKAAK